MLRPNSIFVKENFAKFHKENPQMSSNNLFKVLNQKFKELSNIEKVLSEKSCLKTNNLSVSSVWRWNRREIFAILLTL